MAILVSIAVPWQQDGNYHYSYTIDADVARQYLYKPKRVMANDHMAQSQANAERDQSNRFAQNIGALIALALMTAIAEKDG